MKARQQSGQTAAVRRCAGAGSVRVCAAACQIFIAGPASMFTCKDEGVPEARVLEPEGVVQAAVQPVVQKYKLRWLRPNGEDGQGVSQ